MSTQRRPHQYCGIMVILWWISIRPAAELVWKRRKQKRVPLANCWSPKLCSPTPEIILACRPTQLPHQPLFTFSMVFFFVLTAFDNRWLVLFIHIKDVRLRKGSNSVLVNKKTIFSLCHL